jgi:hypothetical protein
MDFLKNAVTLSVFELGICSLHQNGTSFQKKLIGTVFSMLVRLFWALSEKKKLQRPSHAQMSRTSEWFSNLSPPIVN